MPFIRLALRASVPALAAMIVCAPMARAQRRTCRVVEVQISPSDPTVAVNGQQPVLATGFASNGDACENITFAWQSSAPAIATVDRLGTISGVAIGTATITARTGTGPAAKVGRATVTVTAADVAVTPQGGVDVSIPGYTDRPHSGVGSAATLRQQDGNGIADNVRVDPLQMVMVRGERRWLTFQAQTTSGQPATPVPITFAVDPGGERVAQVDTLGAVTSLSDTGSASIRLTFPTLARIPPKIVRVMVRNDSVRFNKAEVTMAPSDTMTLYVSVPAQDRALEPRMFQFQSSDPTKVTINAEGRLTAVNPGTARISAQSSFLPEFAATVHVHRRVRNVSLVPVGRSAQPDSLPYILTLHGTMNLKASALAVDDGTEVPQAPISWRSQDTSLIRIEPAPGDSSQRIIRGIRTGNAIVNVSTPSGDSVLAAQLRIRVIAGGLATARTRIGMAIGQSVPFEITLVDEQRHPIPGGSANQFITRWDPIADSVVRIDGGNSIVAVKPGHAHIVGHTGWDSTVTVDVFVVGDMLAVGRQDGRRGLLMLNSSGQVLSRLSNDSLVERGVFSTGLTRIAYTARRILPRSTPSVLFVANSDSSGRRQITDDSLEAYFPSFVPNETAGSRLVFEYNKNGRPQIWSVELHDTVVGTPTPITSGNYPNKAPAVSPDSRHIAYFSYRETSPGRPLWGLFVASIDGSEEHQVYQFPQGFRPSQFDSPSFSLDGSMVYFVRAEPPRNNLPTNRVVRISATAAPTDTIMAVTRPDLVVRSFSMSADGTTMLLWTSEPVPRGERDQGITHLVSYVLTTNAPTVIDVPAILQIASPVLRPPQLQRPAGSPGR